MNCDTAETEETSTQWTSITGQPLKLDAAPKVLGIGSPSLNFYVAKLMR